LSRHIHKDDVNSVLLDAQVDAITMNNAVQLWSSQTPRRERQYMLASLICSLVTMSWLYIDLDVPHLAHPLSPQIPSPYPSLD